MNKIKLIFLFIVTFLFTNNVFALWDEFLPVAKIVSYKDIFWTNIEKIWQWSAIFLNNSWYLLTSSLIIKDLERENTDYYNICLTKDYLNKPNCNYTASLISIDDNLELAILKLNNKDILWNNVDLSKLTHIDIAYDYLIKKDDDVFGMWLSWASEGLLVKKNSKILWDTSYKNHRYIRSNIIISNNNPWGALLNKDWKIIWIPSLFLWKLLWYSDLYSISINEAKTFIDTNIWRESDHTINIDNFTKNLQVLNNINSNLRISDNLLSFSFTKDYEVKRYNKDKWFVLKPNSDDTTLVSYFKVSLEKNIKVDNQDELLYFLSSQNAYDKNIDKLSKFRIGQTDFTHIKRDNDSLIEKHIYATKLEDKLVIIFLNRQKFSDKSKEKISKAYMDTLFLNLVFNKTWIKTVSTSFDISLPKIKIYTWWLLSDTSWNAIYYFWKITDYFQLSLREIEKINWKTKTFDEIYKEDTIWIENDFKKKIKFLWHPGYIYCINKDIKSKNEKWTLMYKRICIINIYENIKWLNNKEYYLQWTLVSNKKTIIDNITKANKYLEENVSLEKTNDWVTKLVNVYKSIIPLKFKDIKYQSDNYKSVLKILVKYKLISNSLYLNPDEPIKWKDFVKSYFIMKYNYKFNTKYSCNWWQYSCLFQNNYVDINGRKTSLFTLFKDMKIPLDYYVDYDKALVFPEYLELKLAWINAEYSEEWLKKYEKFKNDSAYSEIKAKIDLYNANNWNEEFINIYDEIWIEPNENITYFQTKNVYFMFDKKSIIKKDIYKKGQFEFTSKNKINNDYCKWAYINKCYKVMTKSMMIDLVVPKINFSIFE